MKLRERYIDKWGNIWEKCFNYKTFEEWVYNNELGVGLWDNGKGLKKLTK
jgi:hypothetical protein